MKLQRILSLAMLVAALGRYAAAQTTATTTPVGLLNVQGVLHENGQPINGFMDFCWGIFNVANGGTRLATDTNMNNNVLVSNGVANVTFNVGNLAALGLSPTQELYLELDMRRSGTSNAFTVLSPRQRIVPAMFATIAVRAEEARRLIEPLDVSLLPPTVPRLDGSATFQGPLTTRANLSAARLEVGTGHVLLGAGASIAGGTSNTNRAEAATIGGGAGNTIQPTAAFAAISGGAANWIGSSYCFIGGGTGNSIATDSDYSVIGGGDENDIGDHSDESTVGGGTDNDIADNSPESTIGGGTGNDIGIYAPGATIAGGEENLIYNGGTGGTIGGGNGNLIAGYFYATIPGGHEARTSSYGQMAYASGKFSSVGDAQSSLYVLRGVSSAADSAAWTELFLDGASERMHVSPTEPGAWTYDILIIGRNSTGSHGFHLVGVIDKQAGAMTVTPLTTDGYTALLNARVTGNLADSGLRIEVRWQTASSDTKWVASVRTAEVTLPAN